MRKQASLAAATEQKKGTVAELVAASPADSASAVLALIKHLRPLLVEEEMDLSYSDEPLQSSGLLIRGRLKHLPSGHYEDYFMPAPLDTTGSKSEVQAVGSTNSFLRRYITCNIFNIVVVGDDDDGNGGTIDEAQTKTILELIERAR